MRPLSVISRYRQTRQAGLYGPRHYEVVVAAVVRNGRIRYEPIRIMLPEELEALGGRMLYRQDERLWYAGRTADYREALAWQGYQMEVGDELIPLTVAFTACPAERLHGWSPQALGGTAPAKSARTTKAPPRTPPARGDEPERKLLMF